MNGWLHHVAQVLDLQPGFAVLRAGMEIAVPPGMIQFTDRELDRLPKPQAEAISVLLHHVTDRRHQVGTGHEVVYTVEVKRTDYGTAWVTIKPDVPSLPETNALRGCERIETWHVHVGKRGRLEAWSYPHSLDQFMGQQWCGIHIMMTELEKKRRAEKRAKKENAK